MKSALVLIGQLFVWGFISIVFADSSNRTPLTRLTITKENWCFIKRIGEGSYGEVSIYKKQGENKLVAMKETHEALKEYNVLLRLNQIGVPHIPQVYEAGLHDPNSPFLTMELVEGLSLENLFKGDIRPAVKEQMGIFARIAETLHALHEAGYVHRDVKPHNIMLSKDGTVRLVDFGLTTKYEEERRGDIYGTSGYIAPEYYENWKPYPPVDIFALGVTMYQSLFGGAPNQHVPSLVWPSYQSFLEKQPSARLSEAQYNSLIALNKQMLGPDKERPSGEQVKKQLEEIFEEKAASWPLPTVVKPSDPLPDSAKQILGKGNYLLINRERMVLYELKKQNKKIENITDPDQFALLLPGRPLLGSEDLAKISLANMVERLKSITPTELKDIRKVARVLSQIHEAGFVHFNIRPENMLYDDSPLGMTLIDFRDARKMNGESPLDLLPLSTPKQYLPPEYLEDKIVSPAIDIYSLGVSLYELIFEELPRREGAQGKVIFPDVHELSTSSKLQLITEQKYKQLCQLLQEMLGPAAARPSAKELDVRLGLIFPK